MMQSLRAFKPLGFRNTRTLCERDAQYNSKNFIKTI